MALMIWARRSVLWAATRAGTIDALVQRVMEGIMAFPVSRACAGAGGAGGTQRRYALVRHCL